MKSNINYYTLMILILPFCIMCALGTWQIFRFKEKLNIIHSMKSLPIALPNDDVKKYAYKNVIARGSFEVGSYFNVFAGNAGYYFLQPFKLIDGRTILVNRGILTDYKNLVDKLDGKIININGIIYCDFDKKVRWFFKNDPANNVWIWFDINSMAKVSNIQLEACIVWADNTWLLSGLKPNMTLQVRNDHLEYIITWYFLAIVWAIYCVSFVRKKKCV